MKINLSFKQTELYLYLHVKGQLSPCVYIKQLILDDINRKKQEVSNGR